MYMLTAQKYLNKVNTKIKVFKVKYEIVRIFFSGPYLWKHVNYVPVFVWVLVLCWRKHEESGNFAQVPYQEMSKLCLQNFL